MNACVKWGARPAQRGDEIQRVMKLLEDYSIQPKRAFGQNFLIDESIIEKIINSLDVEKYETVLEIGPGLGALTIPLRKRAKRMIAVEADRDMASILSKELKDSENFTLINEPFEHWNHDGLDTTNLLVVGNLPYNLTTNPPTIRRLYHLRNGQKNKFLCIPSKKESKGKTKTIFC
uniref:rRNA adenine N(6)-methyltransferase n=1 Tax=Junco hyemalis TaxID=40217 RepID=A0A8C5NJL7_JUNHY